MLNYSLQALIRAYKYYTVEISQRAKGLIYANTVAVVRAVIPAQYRCWYLAGRQIFLGTPHARSSDIAHTIGRLSYGSPLNETGRRTLARGFQQALQKEGSFESISDHTTWRIVCAYEEYGSPEVRPSDQDLSDLMLYNATSEAYCSKRVCRN